MCLLQARKKKINIFPMLEMFVSGDKGMMGNIEGLCQDFTIIPDRKDSHRSLLLFVHDP